MADIENNPVETPDSAGRVYKPAQEKLEKQIKDFREKIETLEKLRDAGLATQDNLKQLKEARVVLEKLKGTLRRKINETRRSKEFRERKAELVSTLASESVANAEKLRSVTRDGPGRSPVEDSYHHLHEAIIRIASSLAGWFNNLYISFEKFT